MKRSTAPEAVTRGPLPGRVAPIGTARLLARVRGDDSQVRGVGALGWTPPVEQIAAPALVVQGTADPIVWPWVGEALAERIPAAQLAMMEGCGHMPRLDCPDAVLDRVQAFLQTID